MFFLNFNHKKSGNVPYKNENAPVFLSVFHFYITALRLNAFVGGTEYLARV